MRMPGDNANDIADAVADRTMPPWPPDPTYSGFAHQRVLSQSDRDRIADWLTDGAPEGGYGAGSPIRRSIPDSRNSRILTW